MSEAMLARRCWTPKRNVPGGGHRWERSGSCPWRAIVRMEGGDSTLTGAIRLMRGAAMQHGENIYRGCVCGYEMR
jgi:hypothetical protein